MGVRKNSERWMRGCVIQGQAKSHRWYWFGLFGAWMMDGTFWARVGWDLYWGGCRYGVLFVMRIIHIQSNTTAVCLNDIQSIH